MACPADAPWVRNEVSPSRNCRRKEERPVQPQNPKKDQHILPRLYLRGFAVSQDKPFVYVYEKGVKTEPKIPAPISKASVIPYAYGYTRRDGT